MREILPQPGTIRRYRERSRVSRFSVLCLCLLWSSAVCAGEAKGQFQVGITITGKRASSAPALPAAPEQAAAGAAAAAFAKAATPKRVRRCLARSRSYDPAPRIHVAGAGSVHRCP
jgi:hypothetical protein